MEETRANYRIPDVELVRADGERVRLRQEIDDGRPVVLNFIFTTCTAICPVMSQTLSQVERRLGADRGRVHIVSISIDPEEDTPARLSAYARRFHAGPEWNFYTGTVEASVLVQRAFDAYRGDKMNHVPVTYLRRAPGRPWVRLEGFARADETVKAVRQILTDEDDPMKMGERIYREGVLPSGKLLKGIGPGGVAVSGKEAACARCHRPSGMGMVEGNRIIPPISGPFLYRTRAGALSEMDAAHTRGADLAHALGRSRSREPYTERTLPRAIRDGIDSHGRTLEALMPRYRLGDSDVRLLADYLKQLSSNWSPGVTNDTLHFATVVAPGVDPIRKKAMLDVLRSFFAVRNESSRLARLREQAYPGAENVRYRSWELHSWELTGAPDTWESQLVAFEKEQPVFALLSGMSQSDWAPVHSFCEKRKVPCWFPIVDRPSFAPDDFYSVYFSKEIVLEAEILGRYLGDRRRAKKMGRVIQVRGEDEREEAAARSLKEMMGTDGVPIVERVIHRIDAASLRGAIGDLVPGDALVLWLRANDLALLNTVLPPNADVYLSATLTGAEHAPLAPRWKRQARLIYPYELPEKRRPNLNRFGAWLKTRGLALVDERVQADAWLACLLMAQKVDEMLENLYRDHLLERAEAILDMRVSSGMYQHLSLGPAQRFASRGGYIARFAAPEGSALTAETALIVP